MGYCSKCGAPCLNCSGEIDGFSLLALPEDLRDIVPTILELMEITSQSNQDTMVRKLIPYMDHPNAIKRAYRIFRTQQLYKKFKNINYFVAIVKNMAITKDPKLAKLPPQIN